MIVVDAIMYAYEADALAVRLAELAGHVSAHVVTQGDHTFRGDPRTVVMLEGVTNSVTHLAGYGDPWAAEAALRDASLTNAIAATDDDPGALYLVSDCDEIPHPDAITQAVEQVPSRGPMVLQTSHRQWSMNLETILHAPGRKPGPMRHQAIIGTAAQLLSAGGAQEARTHAKKRGWPVADAVGWHLTNLMPPEAVVDKIRAYAHSEYDTPEWRAQVAQMRDEGRDYLGRSGMRHTDDLPSCAPRFPHLVRS